jgi:hypothetical protein
MQKNIKSRRGNLILFIWESIGVRQPPLVRWLHLIILCLVLNQIVISNFMGFGRHDAMSNLPIKYYCTWIHLCGGLALIPLTTVFIFLEFRYHGVNYFFGYLRGHFSQLKEDIRQLSQFKLPEPQAQGLAAAVQGLGMGALILVLGAGLIWFFAWLGGMPWEHMAKEVHEALTGLIELYVIGHGVMGVIHLFYQWKNGRATS